MSPVGCHKTGPIELMHGMVQFPSRYSAHSGIRTSTFSEHVRYLSLVFEILPDLSCCEVPHFYKTIHATSNQVLPIGGETGTLYMWLLAKLDLLWELCRVLFLFLIPNGCLASEEINCCACNIYSCIWVSLPKDYHFDMVGGPSTLHDPESDTSRSLSSWQGHPSW
jgi:hypothetical protein